METTATFGRLELVTSPCVMTPRETSTGLVVCATDHLEGRPGVVVDVGTGSGAKIGRASCRERVYDDV